MSVLEQQHSRQLEEQLVLDALACEPVTPGVADTDALFLLELDVPDKIKEKLKRR